MENNNLEYFTLEEDSEVEEFVAEDPSYQRKVFWYDLVEKTIRSCSKRQLFLAALLSIVGFYLQLRLIVFLAQNRDIPGLAWTLSFIILTGAGNLVFGLHHRNPSMDTVVLLPRRLSSKLVPAIHVLRHVCSFAMLSPLFNLFYYWFDTGKNETDLRRPLVLRSQPQPSKLEIQSVQKSLEGHLEKSYLHLIETFLQFLTFGLLQAFLYVHYGYKPEEQDPADPEEAEPDEAGLINSDYGIRGVTIAWNLFMFPLACTVYANAQFHYMKALQFQDLKDLGTPMHLSKVSALNSCFTYLTTYFSVGFRVYCIALLVSTLHYWVLLFLLLTYGLFHFLVSTMPSRARLRYENPPSGHTSVTSDLISRWLNLFCSHNVKYECSIHFTYLFSALYFIFRASTLAPQWAQLFDTEDYGGNSTVSNRTVLGTCHEDRMILRVPVLTPIVEFSFWLIIKVTSKCSAHLDLLQNDYGALVLFAVMYSLSLFYMVKARSRIQAETEFPVQAACRAWAEFLGKDWESNDLYMMKKHLLCMILADKDLSALAIQCRKHWIWSLLPCSRLKSPKPNPELEIGALWALYEKKTSGIVLSPTLGRLEQIIERRKTLRNSADWDVKFNVFLEFLIENYVLEEDAVRILLYAIEHFDVSVARSSSWRLYHLQQILR